MFQLRHAAGGGHGWWPRLVATQGSTHAAPAAASSEQRRTSQQRPSGAAIPDMPVSIEPLPGASFGAAVSGIDLTRPETWPTAAQLRDAWYEAGGLLVFRGLAAHPPGLVALARLFGTVEDMVETRTAPNMVMEAQSEIFLVHGADYSRKPPALPEGGDNTVVQFPARKGWHSDQSFRRPPPDASLLYCARPALPNQGRTLFCDATAAHDALSPAEVAEVEEMSIIHCVTSAGRSEASVRAGNTRPSRSDDAARYLAPVTQPAVRVHPVTQRRSLYLVMGQADWLDGPIAGMEPGPDGAGADVLRGLVSHATQPRFVYAHEWSVGDCVLYDNRSLLHAATWFDEGAARREMWRLTVTGNPGPEFDEEVPSWQQLPGTQVEAAPSSSSSSSSPPSSVARL